MTDLLVAVPPISAGPLKPIVHGGPAEDGVAPKERRFLRLGISVAGAVFVLAVLIGLHVQILGGVRSLLALEPGAMVAVVCCVLMLVMSRAAVNRLTHPKTSLFQGFMLDQISLAATNTMPGGSVLGPAARYRVSRSFGHSPEQSAIGTFAVGQAFCFGRWFLMLLVIGHQFASGSTSATDLMVLVSAIGALAIGAGIWTVLATESTISRLLIALTQFSLNRLGLRWKKFRDTDVATIACSLRTSATSLGGARAFSLVCLGVLSSLASGAIIVVVVTTLGSGAGDPGFWTLMRVYLLARVATSFVPTPGALAALDAALIAGLMTAGVEPQVATAAVLIYRATTFVLPIVVGAVTYFGWRRWSHLGEHEFQPAPPSAV
jgi:uncharacterized membrane protein YbhN (UPF0104 family)